MGIIDDIYSELAKDSEPKCDIIKCYDCNRTYKLDKCETIQDGDWESGYYDVYVCPKNPDHEVELGMSRSQMKKYEEWRKNGSIS